MLEVRPLSLGGVLEIVPRKFGDERGFFSETFNAETLAAQGVELSFVQDNHSYSALAGTLRGLHYQLPPKAQAKLVRVVRGRVFDVVVDIRKGSPSFAKWLGLELSAERWNQILVPAGFAHGFVTLEPETEVLYKVTEHYSAEHERSIRFDDPAIGIGWPVAADRLQLSAKDRNAALLNESNLFEFTA
ncbi:dTDP-4-dehydrorhamnose 3,5-epimerase [Sinorhizobium medicae]|uniref:dTDP-4-dehydrorhamnose 3,5-epimerase n=2 Tax=Sinorhizobium medicae TaxID=110321 RepID=A0A6G1WN07_9HYPH|nr:dTDP-4-dehydrorhamnose 3,5-epimerase [Sinorhizobium medicae]ABR63519.1 dTDP-4-dehydrorhamnose 3,5-epimerase [Sinorhizobium medicae WSM419]MBO1960824.1 dTDP-4-dehydrorhamnose 3,5-epimerase [Sinorhizobium medicae]MDX0407509.1 dTDP-4-dehydrorhamnose 3,5-epimerase [Sinorhizobium medicae]MDX0413274.1 dTDP-4-dehydrorhamnose 3,5-epimerase [Sinorhizobium medicae]MDX0419439.1 dTDP-4-dehydrorhamnose 3,5-epimerase [Sinorhizobium medicae]